MTDKSPIRKQIVILPGMAGDVVARYAVLGKVAGEFSRVPGGEICFRYHNEGNRCWYVNKSMAGFREAATVFNRCCELHAGDQNTDDEAAWALVVAQLRSEFERIEPLGDPETSLWSATIYDTDGGLLTLY